MSRTGYREIAAILREWVRSGRFRAGDKFPTEASLADSFKVSRLTIRRALAVLIKEDILIARQGSGTFVSEAYKPVALRVDARSGVATTFETWGNGWSYDLIGWSQVDVPADVYETFGVGKDTSFFEYNYVHNFKDEPAARISFLLVDWAADLLNNTSEAVLLHSGAYLDERGLTRKRTRFWISATIADTNLASQLNVAVGFPIVRVLGYFWDDRERLYQRYVSMYRADRFEYKIDFDQSYSPIQTDDDSQHSAQVK